MYPQRNGGRCKPWIAVFVFVASEPRGRNRKGVELLRDCCVNAYGLLDPEWLRCSNLSGTAGVNALVSRNYLWDECFFVPDNGDLNGTDYRP